MSDKKLIQQAAIPLERDGFFRQILRHLAGSLENVVGLEEAEGFISIVGQKMADEIDQHYTKALNIESLDRKQVAAVLVDLKRRINGDFHVIEESHEKIVFRNNRCPFGNKVIGRPSLCMMTTNVFGVITAENLGYSRVTIDEAIARGDSGCTVTVYLQPDDENNQGVEFFSAN